MFSVSQAMRSDRSSELPYLQQTFLIDGGPVICVACAEDAVHHPCAGTKAPDLHGMRQIELNADITALCLHADGTACVGVYTSG